MARQSDATVLCVKGPGNGLSITKGKRYRVVSDPDAEARGRLRVVDDTGEDYVYSASLFEHESPR